MSDEPMAYVGYCDCGGMVLALVDMPQHKAQVAKDVAKAIRDGLRIDRVTCDFVRKYDGWGCTDTCACATCEKRRKKRARLSPQTEQASE